MLPDLIVFMSLFMQKLNVKITFWGFANILKMLFLYIRIAKLN